MHINSFREISESKAMNNARRNKYYIDEKHLDTKDAGYFHALILWFDSELSDKRIETIRKKLIAVNPKRGEILDIPSIIKFYGTKQLILS